MSILVGCGLLLVLFVFFMYPALVFIDTMLETRDFEHRIGEWRELLAQQIIVEWQMLCTINEVRKKLGMEPLPQHAIIEQFKGFGGWTGFRLKVQQSVKMAIQKFTWFKSAE